jgi:hypothetical protein
MSGKSSGHYSHSPKGTHPPTPPSEARTRQDRTIRYPHGNSTLAGVVAGHMICPRCHAIYDNKHWHLNEEEYQRLAKDPTIPQELCPADDAIERGLYDGQVTLTSPLILTHQEEIVGLIRNTEQHIREHNPLARIASMKVEGDTIEVLTITPFLAERIGKELRKAYHGQVEFSHPSRERFVRVTWWRD